MRLPTLFAIALFATTTSLAAQERSDGLPGWLAGAWAMEDGAAWADEVWSAPRGGMMMGSARNGFGPDLSSWQTERIVRRRDGRVSLLVQPEGRAAIEFPMVLVSDNAIEFANPAHDYPQRIRYELVGQLLIAEISRIDGSDKVRWQYRPHDRIGD